MKYVSQHEIINCLQIVINVTVFLLFQFKMNENVSKVLPG